MTTTAQRIREAKKAGIPTQRQVQVIDGYRVVSDQYGIVSIVKNGEASR